MKKLFKTLAVVLLASATTFAAVAGDKMAIKEIDTFSIGMYKMKNTSQVRLMLDKLENSVVSVKLTDEAGNVIHSEFVTKKQTNYSKSFDMSKLADGIYTFTIENGAEKETREITVSTNQPIPVITRTLTVK